MKRPCLILATAIACPAWAQSDTTFMPEGSHDITLIAVAGLAPRSEGSGTLRPFVLPGASVQWSNGVFLDVGTLGMQLSSTGNLRYGPKLGYGIKDERSDDPQRKMRLDLQAGGFASYQLLHNLNLHSDLMYGGSDDYRGVQLNVGATLSGRLTSHQAVALSVGANFVDQAYMQSYFGVTAQQAAQGHRRAYHASGGLKNISTTGTWHIELNQKYSLATGVNVSWLGDTPAASPLTRNNQGYSLFTLLSYHY
ncbi:MipA/OmpV family protein [Massilia sp. S19_KUP03_FR1]|uniref:MipA/OmpV family protein n=1 Tax=Massilia sp. S19_KUP03_FR1 TaxID=3025503 RepID=UPI002FCDBDB8